MTHHTSRATTDRELFGAIGMNLTRYEVEVLRILKRNEWKTPTQIIEELEKRRFESRHTRLSYRFFSLFSHELAYIILSPADAGVYYALVRLERHGNAEGRPRAAQGLVGGRSEWRLTENGMLIQVPSADTAGSKPAGTEPAFA